MYVRTYINRTPKARSIVGFFVDIVHIGHDERRLLLNKIPVDFAGNPLNSMDF